jgi:hypothetical protein
MVAVGPGAANFVTEMSIIVLKNAPFNVEKWKNIPEDIFNKIVSKVLVNFNLLQFYFILFLLWRTYNSFILIVECRMLLTLIIQHIIEKLFFILLKDYIEIIDVDFIGILANTRQMR